MLQRPGLSKPRAVGSNTCVSAGRCKRNCSLCRHRQSSNAQTLSTHRGLFRVSGSRNECHARRDSKLNTIQSDSKIEQIAEHFGGRRVSSGRWMAKCPAHPDRSPSLSIAAGRDGKVLVRCFAGCDLSAVLRSAGLTIDNLFPGPPPAPEKLAAITAERDRRLAIDRAQRAEERAAVDWLRLRWQELDRDRPILARELAMMPDGAPGEKALTFHFHSALAQMRFIDSALQGEAEWL